MNAGKRIEELTPQALDDLRKMARKFAPADMTEVEWRGYLAEPQIVAQFATGATIEAVVRYLDEAAMQRAAFEADVLARLEKLEQASEPSK